MCVGGVVVSHTREHRTRDEPINRISYRSASDHNRSYLIGSDVPKITDFFRSESLVKTPRVGHTFQTKQFSLRVYTPGAAHKILGGVIS